LAIEIFLNQTDFSGIFAEVETLLNLEVSLGVATF
jgi:hypothetical protein